jgi:ankyrin repeat protein
MRLIKQLVLLTLLSTGLVLAVAEQFEPYSEKQKPLVIAIQKGDAAKIRSIIEHDFNSTLKDQKAIILYCLDAKTAFLLHQYGASYTEQDPFGTNLLMVGAQNGNLDLVKLAFDSGLSVNSKNFDGNTPLYFSVGNLHPQIAEFLIEHGAYVNEQDSQGETILIRAATEGDLSMVQLLLANGADPGIYDSNHKLPIDYAEAAPRSYSSKETYQEIVKLLKEKMSLFNSPAVQTGKWAAG